MDKFVIILNKERLYLTDRVLFANDKMYDDGTPKNGLAVEVFTDNIFDDLVLTFDSLDDAIKFINDNKDSLKELISLYKKYHLELGDKIELYPSKVVPMYNIHKAIEL